MSDIENDKEYRALLKEELIAKAGNLGVEVDRRWSPDRLQAAIDDAENRGDEEQEEMTDNSKIEGDDVAFQPLNPPETPPAPRNSSEPMVTCRVTKKGDRKIHTGDAAPNERFAWGDIIQLAASTANNLEERAYVEIGTPG